MSSDVTINNALDFAQQSSNASAQLAEDFDDFLILLVTQLQNQDPLDPADSTEFTNQIVNFAGVEQQINANQRLEDLVALSIGSSFSSALNYVGKDISYLSSEAYFDGATPVNVSYAVTGDAAKTTINIFDENGTLVYSEDVASGADSREFVWDGKDKNGFVMPEGTYQVRVDAFDAGNNDLETTTVVQGHVNGIETQNGTTFLLVGERAVSIGNIINVKEAATPEPPPANNTGGGTT